MRNSVASAGLKPYLLANRSTASASIVSANDVIERVRARDMVAEKVDMVDFCKLTKFFISILFRSVAKLPALPDSTLVNANFCFVTCR